MQGKTVGVYSNAGFMSQDVDGVILGMKSLLDNPDKMAIFDHKVSPIPWRDHLFSPKRKLKIGW